MFWKKEAKITAVPIASTAVQVMPKEFYGGANPVVTFRDVKKEVLLNKDAVSKTEKVLLEKSTAVGAGAPFHPSNLLTSNKFLLLAGSALFILFSAGAGLYYWRQSNQTADQTPIRPIIEDSALPVEPEMAPIETPLVSEETDTSTETIISPAIELLEFPAMFLSDSVDLDNDGLSDLAEEIFGTDPALPDSDNDSYADAHEIFYLYNPSGQEPMRLIEAGTVKEYINPVFGYSLYFPINWAVGNTKEDYRDILFSTLTGDNIEILAVDKEVGEDFESWLAKNAPSEQFNYYKSFESRFQATGYERVDKLVYFLAQPTRVYIIAYHVSDTNMVNFRLVADMMARSFKSGGANGNASALEIMEQEAAEQQDIDAGTPESVQ